MAKKKFNREERQAIIKKLKNIANERMSASWDKQRAAYRPSAEYQRAKILLESRNNICEELKEIDDTLFGRGWSFENVNSQDFLNELRDKEIKPLVERYKVDETNLEVEIILMDQDRPIDDLIERLLRGCKCE